MSYSLEIYMGYGIPFLKDRRYHTYIYTTKPLHFPTGSLRSHNACPLHGPLFWHRRPQPASILTQISQTNMCYFLLLRIIHEYYKARSAIDLFQLNEWFLQHLWGFKLEYLIHVTYRNQFVFTQSN